MTHKFKIGVIGAGMFGQVHLQHFQQDGRAEVTWVCSASAESVQTAQERFGITHGTRDYREMLKDPALEAVVITSPPDTHVPMAIAALRAGKHVLLEKPMTTTRRAMHRLLAEVERHPGQVVLECSARHTRLQPKFGFVKGLIDSGRLGQVYHIHHRHLMPSTFVEYNPKGAWAMDKRQAGGGPFFDWGVYDLSFHLGVLGDAPQLKKIRSFHRNDLRDMTWRVPVADIEQHGAAFMEFDTGLTYYYERGAGVHADVPNETRIFGTKGSLRLTFPTWDSNEMEFFSVSDRGEVTRETLTVDMSAHPANDNIALVGHFLDCLEGKSTPMMPVTLAAKHLDILLSLL
jgi:predicted dehydrogenase